MEERKRTLFAVIIALVLMVALLYSFGLNLFTQQPQFELADPDLVESSGPGSTLPGDGNGGILLEVTPETVQSIIASLLRYESYSRTLTLTYSWGDNQTASASVQVWEDNGRKRTEIALPSGIKECSIIENDRLWLWYESETGESIGQIYKGTAADASSDLFQRIPTYEDVLAVDTAYITKAGYEEYNGQPCIYVEVEQQELGYLYRYWISEISGLLMAAETEKSGVLVYRVKSNEVISPIASDGEMFLLPDGTIPFSVG